MASKTATSTSNKMGLKSKHQRDEDALILFECWLMINIELAQDANKKRRRVRN